MCNIKNERNPDFIHSSLPYIFIDKFIFNERIKGVTKAILMAVNYLYMNMADSGGVETLA